MISPLELLFEVVFTVANRIIGNAGLSIIFLSLAVNFLVLPLYKRADELQAEEREIQVKMAPHIKHIKKMFKGDERFFMLQEYYYLNHYKPVYALKSSVSLLLQVPFFIAAYNLLSGMQSLQGMQFGPITDLGKEDAMFMIGSFPVNVLPILMTLINIVSGIIYTKGHPVKEKIQVYGLAAVFLVLLYRSPSGLVFYWLLNNVFSLVKNVFYKLKDPRKALNTVLAIAGAVILVLTLIRPDLDARQKFLLATGCVLLAAPLISQGLKNLRKEKAGAKQLEGRKSTFFAGAVFMAMLTGFFIPSSVINASALEFIDATNPSNPVLYIVNSMLLSFGSFVLWGGIFYFFMSKKVRGLFCVSVWAFCGISILDYMLFGTDLGILSSTLQFDITPSFELSEYAVNILAAASVAVLFYFIYRSFPSVSKTVMIIGIMTLTGLGAISFAEAWGSYSWYRMYTVPSEGMPEIPLSRNGKNVVVLMMDKSKSLQMPYILNEKPELIEKFDGFTFYPNTISYGAFTNFGTPALFGGYEYTPERMNERDDMLLEDKHNEALKVMPVIFGDNGYEVTIFDPSYAGYEWVPDLSIFDDHPEFHCFNTKGRFNFFEKDSDGTSAVRIAERIDEIRNRNLYCYSMMKISPVLLQETLYDGGVYNISESVSEDMVAPAIVQHIDGLSKSSGYNHDFIDTYTVLTSLPEITVINDSSENTFLMMTNEATHSPCLLQEPDYVPATSIDNTAYDVDMEERYTIDGKTMQMTTVEQVTSYHVSVASLLAVGEWFDYLREQGVYDNTRIIIVSDHGQGLNQFGITCCNSDMEYFMPLLMVKDFNSTGFKTSNKFMTNADTPTLATADIIDDPVNPFTNKPINSDPKVGPQTVFLSYDIYVDENNGYKYFPGAWFSVKGDPHRASNWKYLGDY